MNSEPDYEDLKRLRREVSILKETAKVYDLQNPAAKMSKSGEADNGNAGAEKIGPVGAGANDMIKFFMDRGWSQAQATGIVANLQQESGLNHKAENKNGMYGLAQWDTKRRAEFKKIMGMDIKESKREHQLAFIQYELTQGKEKAAGDKLRATKTKEDVVAPVGYDYLDWVSGHADLPFVAIGGIKQHNIAEVARHGARCCSLVSELVGAPDIRARVAAVRNAMREGMVG